MALGDNNFTQLFTSTLQKYEKQLVDNVLKAHPVLDLFKGQAKSNTGRGLVVPLRAANLSATGYTDASGSHSTSVSSDILGSAVYEWADTIITPFRVKHRDILQNSGPEQIVNLVEEYVKAASADHGDFIVAELHKNTANFETGNLMPLDMVFGNASSDSYFDGSNADWVPVGGINPNSAGKSYWASTREEIADSAADIVAAFRTITNDIYRNSRKRPNVAIVGFDVYEEFEAYLVEKGQYQLLQGGQAQTRFTSVKFGDLEVRLDPDCADDRAYFLNTESLRFAYCSGEFMKAFPAQPLEGTLDTVVPLASSLTFGTTERRANGVLIRTYA
jgi:hypothetical protein